MTQPSRIRSLIVHFKSAIWGYDINHPRISEDDTGAAVCIDSSWSISLVKSTQRVQSCLPCKIEDQFKD